MRARRIDVVRLHLVLVLLEDAGAINVSTFNHTRRSASLNR